MILLALAFFSPVALAAALAVATAAGTRDAHPIWLPVIRGAAIGNALLCLATAAQHHLL